MPDLPRSCTCGALASLAAAGWSVVRTSEYEELLEIKAEHENRFPRCLIVKPERDRDMYVGWSEVCEMPAGVWTRTEALGDGCPESRLRRADETGTSSLRGFYRWDSAGMIAEQRGYLPRSRLADYALAYMENRFEDCWDMLKPFEGETEVRRG